MMRKMLIIGATSEIAQATAKLFAQQHDALFLIGATSAIAQATTQLFAQQHDALFLVAHCSRLKGAGSASG